MLPTADAAAGQKISARCEQCHDLSKGGPNKIGPNLWGVIGRARASRPGFSYSGAMKADHGPWTFDKFFKFLKAPQSYVPGTKMSFAGLSQRGGPHQPARLAAHAERQPAADPAARACEAPGRGARAERAGQCDAARCRAQDSGARACHTEEELI